MDISRQKEILTFFAKGDIYDGPKLKDMDFTQAELAEFSDTEDIVCVDRDPLRYKITIKGSRHLKRLRSHKE